MALGRSIRIYLDSGEVSGVRHAELVNWTGQAILCPRNRMGELARWDTVAQRPGVYFLIGAEQLTARDVYIGEAENVEDRVKRHLAEREFWQEAVIFTSKDENITKAHVKYLESRLIEMAFDAGRYVVLNQRQPSQTSLPRADRDAMEEFLGHVRLLLGALGHRVLDPIADRSTTSGVAPMRLTYSIKNANATGAVVDDGFVVFKGSTALPQVHESIRSSGYAALKEDLIATAKLVTHGELLRFSRDVLFSSASAAAAVVYGNSANGRICWKSEDGRTLKQIEEEQAGGGG